MASNSPRSVVASQLLPLPLPLLLPLLLPLPLLLLMPLPLLLLLPLPLPPLLLPLPLLIFASLLRMLEVEAKISRGITTLLARTCASHSPTEAKVETRTTLHPRLSASLNAKEDTSLLNAD